jgi:hypothetical protein
MTFELLTRRFVRRGLVATSLLTLAALAATSHVGVARADQHQEHGEEHEHPEREPHRFTVGLFGDMPYNALGKQQYPNLLQDVNDAHVAFSIFDGDLKAGGDGPCTDANVYTPSLDAFGMLWQPLVWLPGDNDWTDCWGRGAGTSAPGADDPLERLAHERSLFAATDFSLGQKTLRLTRESREGGSYALYSENVRWQYGGVVFIGMNVQGSNDNYPYAGVDGETRTTAQIEVQRAEERARKAANLHWLSEGFDHARRVHAAGVMVVFQADLNFNNEQHLSDTRSYDAFPDYQNALRAAALAFPGQVALVHGDAHYFKIDQPLNGPKGGVVPNFVRVETYGARNTHWVRATIDTHDARVFSFEPRIVPGNTD